MALTSYQTYYMKQKNIRIAVASLFLTAIFTGTGFSQEKVITDITPVTWKAEPIIPGQSSLYGLGQYTIRGASPNLLKGLMLVDDYKDKMAPFTLEFESSEDITVYVFMYGNENEWSQWPVSKSFIKWELTKEGKPAESKHFMHYKTFPKGNVSLSYQPTVKAGTRPFFIITSKSLLLEKTHSEESTPPLKLITLNENDQPIRIDGLFDTEELQASKKINLYLPEQTGGKISTVDPEEKTDVYISRHDNHLNIHAVCHKMPGSEILTNVKTNIIDLYKDEAFEIYIKPEKDAVNYAQIVINSLGYYYITGKTTPDVKRTPLEIKTSKQADRWELELAIPLKIFTASDLIGLNFTRTTYDPKQIIQERTGWATTVYNDIDHYGTLFLAGGDDAYNRKTVTELEADYAEKLKAETNRYQGVEETPYDAFMLWPEPKFITKWAGRIPLHHLTINDLSKAPHTAELLKKELAEKYNFLFSAENKYPLTISLANHPNIQGILKKHGLDEKLKGKHPDAFIISSSDNGVLICGNNERGIYYGIRAFLNSVDYYTGSGENPHIGFMNIADWPDQEMRFLFWRIEGITRETKPDIAMIKKYIYDIAAGSKYNGIVFMVQDGVQYLSAPEIRTKGAFTREEFKDIVSFCRENYIDPIPAMNTPGHAGWIVRKHNELGELNVNTICTRNPASLKLIFDIAEEMIELCGGVGRVKYFHVGRDEIRWEANDRKHQKIKDECAFCKGTPWKDLLLEYIKHEHAFFTERDIRMIMWSDMFDENRNGKRYNTADILKDVPKDIILSPWSADGYPAIKDYIKMGFDVIKGATGYKVVSVFDDVSIGHMFAIFSRDPWMNFTIVKLSSHNYYNHLSVGLYGGNAWKNDLTLKPNNPNDWENLKATVQKRGEEKKLTFLFENGNAFTYLHSKKRFPSESDVFQEIDISKYCNTLRLDCFNAGDLNDLSGLKTGNQVIAGIPTRIEEKIIVLQDDPVQNIEISTRASSLLFLYAAYLAPEKEEAFKVRIRRNPEFKTETKRNPIAYYLIKYDDETTEEIVMNYGFNVGELRPPLHSRYTYDSRYVHRAVEEGESWPEVQDCRDCSPGAPAAYQYEWVNPYPEKEIVSMDFIPLNSEVVPALISLTARAVKPKDSPF